MNVPLPLGTGIRLFSLLAFLTLSNLSSRFEIWGVDDDEAQIGCRYIKRSWMVEGSSWNSQFIHLKYCGDPNNGLLGIRPLLSATGKWHHSPITRLYIIGWGTLKSFCTISFLDHLYPPSRASRSCFAMRGTDFLLNKWLSHGHICTLCKPNFLHRTSYTMYKLFWHGEVLLKFKTYDYLLRSLRQKAKGPFRIITHT